MIQLTPSATDISDLLPPSPTTAGPSNRFFPTPSPLGPGLGTPQSLANLPNASVTSLQSLPSATHLPLNEFAPPKPPYARHRQQSSSGSSTFSNFATMSATSHHAPGGSSSFTSMTSVSAGAGPGPVAPSMAFTDSDQGYGASVSNEDLSSGSRLGPPVRPLDLGSMDKDGLFAELGETVGGLKAWLENVHVGLADLTLGWEADVSA